MKDFSASIATDESLPESIRAEVIKQLADNEQLVAWMEGDLDANLHFARYLLVLSNSGILSKADTASSWQVWHYRAGLTLQRHDHAGIGSLELFDGESRLASWRYTLTQNAPAQRIMAGFEQQLAASLSGKPVMQATESVCPNCQAPLAPGQEECPICSIETHIPPSTWVLFRLWQFAQPYKGQLLLGFVLTLVSTAATMVPDRKSVV